MIIQCKAIFKTTLTFILLIQPLHQHLSQSPNIIGFELPFFQRSVQSHQNTAIGTL